MKYRSSLVAVFLLMIVSASASAEAPFFPAPRGKGVKDLYIVELAENVARHPRGPKSSLPAVPEVAEDLGARFGGKVERVWEHVLQAFTIRMPEARARQLAEHGVVARVTQVSYVDDPFSAPVDDCYVYVDNPPGTGYAIDNRTLPLFSPQSLSCSNPDPQSGTTCLDNWGIDRIDQSSVTRNNQYSFGNRGIGVHVYMLDSGIRATHREFYSRLNQSRVSGGVNATVLAGDPARNDTSDCHGHGTHVSGIVAGRTYGVAKDAILHPVRILRCAGQQSQDDWWVEGLNWIAANHNPANEGTAVVSWSGGNNFNWVNGVSSPVRTAVHNLAKIPTLLLVQAAGNQSRDYPTVANACSYSFGDESLFTSDPTLYAAVSRIFVVGGSDENDERWTRRQGDPRYSTYCGGDCGSNVGSCVDIFAPAAHVVSSAHQHNSGYCRLSGTSMAAPHAAGVAALYLQRNRQSSAATVKSTVLQYGQSGALQSNSADPNYIGSGSPNLLLRTSLPVVTCGVDRNFSTPANTMLTFYASTLRGSGCAIGDSAYSGFDTQYGSVSIGGIAPEDIVYYYTPPAGFVGTDSFTYTVYNSAGQVKAMGLVKVTVY